MKIIILGALPASIINFRGDLIKLLLENGMNVTAMASEASKKELQNILKIVDNYQEYDISRNGLSPLRDLKTFCFLFKYLKKNSPDIVFAYTIKPVIWGGLAARFAKVHSHYAMVTGLGYAFQKRGGRKSFLYILVKFLYRFALKKAKGVIFQNKDNMNFFINEGIVDKEKCFIVNGSGVDLNYYNMAPLPEKPQFLLIARLLGDKGIYEYIRAAEIVKKQYSNAVFELLGPEDPSPDGIKLEEINEWCKHDIIKYSGSTSDVRPYIRNCSIYVLPSYHEGLPRSTLEAMSMGRPILTTDVPGCRETVINGANGWLVQKGSFEQLAERMIWFIENSDKWDNMGKISREIASDKFDVKKVNEELLKIMGLNSEKSF